MTITQLVGIMLKIKITKPTSEISTVQIDFFLLLTPIAVIIILTKQYHLSH